MKTSLQKSDLIIHVLSGNGEMVVDENNHEVKAGDVVYCTGKEVFSIKNSGEEDMSLFVILAPNPSPVYSKEI